MDSKRCRIGYTNGMLCSSNSTIRGRCQHVTLASEGALPLLVEAMGVQQKNPYPSSVCASTLTVYIVAGARPVIVWELPDGVKASW